MGELPHLDVANPAVFVVFGVDVRLVVFGAHQRRRKRPAAISLERLGPAPRDYDRRPFGLAELRGNLGPRPTLGIVAVDRLDEVTFLDACELSLGTIEHIDHVSHAVVLGEQDPDASIALAHLVQQLPIALSRVVAEIGIVRCTGKCLERLDGHLVEIVLVKAIVFQLVFDLSHTHRQRVVHVLRVVLIGDVGRKTGHRVGEAETLQEIRMIAHEEAGSEHRASQNNNDENLY